MALAGRTVTRSVTSVCGGSVRVKVGGRSAFARIERALVTAAMLLLAGAGAASADSATVSVTTTTGASDPVAGIPRIVTLSGVASAPARIYVKYRAIGGEPCASSSSSDGGSVLGGFYAERVDGPFSLQDVIAWDTPGDVMFCTWLSTGNADTVTPPIVQVVTFRRPTGSIGATVQPAKPLRGKQAKVDVSGSAELPAAVFASVRIVDGSPCAQTYAEAAGQSLVEGAQVDGAFSLHLTTRQARAGSYVICLWLARSAIDRSPLAGPQPVTFDVGAPPVHCVVPSVGTDRRPATVRRRIRRAHCAVGGSVRTSSRSVRKGAVVRLTRRPHARFDVDTPIGLIVSTGPPTRPQRR
jgi:hypothetical protein